MTGLNPLIDRLIATDHFVIEGLATFDEVTERLRREDIEAATQQIMADGHPNAEQRAEAFASARTVSVKSARKVCQQSLVTAGLQYFVGDDIPEELAHDFALAGICVRAGMEVANLLRSALPLEGQAADADRAGLHRRLWQEALRHITVDDEAAASPLGE